MNNNHSITNSVFINSLTFFNNLFIPSQDLYYPAFSLIILTTFPLNLAYLTQYMYTDPCSIISHSHDAPLRVPTITLQTYLCVRLHNKLNNLQT